MSVPADTRKIAVIGGGISGLAAAHFVRAIASSRDRQVQVDLYESQARPGGKFDARLKDGYLVEAGPNGFLDSKPWTLDLVRQLGMQEQLLPSDQASARRFIFSRGRLHELKAPPAFLLSSLLSWRARIGMGRELFAPKTPPGTDTTLAEFGTRRLGGEVVEKLLDPMVSGIFAGDPHQMSLRASFPRIAELEERYGGLLKAWKSLSRERRAAKRRGEEVGISSGPSGPGGVLTSFKKGVSQLTDRLASDLGEHLHTSRPIRRMEAFGPGLRFFSGEDMFEADGVILAVPSHSAAVILSPAAPASSALLARIPYSPMAVVGVGYDLKDLSDPPDGFGFLIPRVEKRKILGALWTSSIFPGHRSPEGKFLIRVMIGGARDHETPFLPDEALLATVREELAATMGLTAEPAFSTIIRWKEAIPLYTVGHLDRLTEAERALPPHVVLAGNAYRGVGINDCVREAEVAARKVLDGLG